jgi:hypothetical protein
MVDKQTAERRDYARIIATKRLIDPLRVDPAKVIDISAIP